MPLFKIYQLKKDGFSSVVFDYIRFFAALAVVFGHGVVRYFGPFNEVLAPTIGEKIFRAIFSGYGSPAVMVFFVLSGLFIGQSVLSQLNKKQFDYRKYLARRLIRLWLVLVPALILTYIIDYIGLTFLASDAIYQSNKVFGSFDYESLSPSIFISNLFFLQTIATPTLGSNGALWSLSNEFWYYVMFPLLVLPFVSNYKVKVVSACAFAFLLWGIGENIISLFPIWLLGSCLLFIPINKLGRLNYKYLLYTSFITFISVLLFIRLTEQADSKLVERIICGIAFALFCYAISYSDKFVKTTGLHKKVSGELGGFSYTLYLIHTPILCFTRALLVDGDGYLLFNSSNLVVFIGVILGILLVSYILARATEFHTQKVYRYLKV